MRRESFPGVKIGETSSATGQVIPLNTSTFRPRSCAVGMITAALSAGSTRRLDAMLAEARTEADFFARCGVGGRRRGRGGGNHHPRCRWSALAIELVMTGSRM